MQYTKESAIATVEDVKAFFNHLVNERQVVLHPDDRFEDYKFDDGRDAFSQDECAVYNRLMDDSFAVCEKVGADIYVLSLELVQADIA